MMPDSLSPEVLELIATRFRVLAEPARLRILNELMVGERTVSELVDATELHQANVSKHLQLLRTSGFVERRKEGLYAHYRVADHSVGELCRIMCNRLEAEAEEQAALLAGGR
jgi:DNA-binding transcriptional ArsR family regulator